MKIDKEFLFRIHQALVRARQWIPPSACDVEAAIELPIEECNTGKFVDEVINECRSALLQEATRLNTSNEFEATR